MLLLAPFTIVALASANYIDYPEQPPGCPFPTGPYVPPECGPNEYFEVCSFKCPPQTCANIPCDPGDGCCRNECRCIDQYLRADNGTCIPASQCGSSSNSESYAAASSSSQSSVSQASSSSSSYSQGSSSASGGSSNSQSSSNAMAISQASNTQSYSSASAYAQSSSSSTDTGDDPVSNEHANAIYKECPNPCQPTCDDPYSYQRPCLRACLAYGWECKKGYVLYENKCILPEKCPGCQPCPDRCRPTCAVPNPKNCEVNPNCYCPDGYILSQAGGKCIKISECPSNLGCNGDPYAMIQEYPPPCPSTCDNPEEKPCRKMQMRYGCVCKPNLILNKYGYCIHPDYCPGGNPCGVNGTYVSCKSECPSDYCPKDDSRHPPICDRSKRCRGGCICKYKYKLLSIDCPQCILGQDCPPVKCTRPNEVWDRCPSPCLAEDCDDVNNQPTICATLIEPACDPRCVCKSGYYRNEVDICVPPCDCPTIGCNGDPNASYDECPTSCPATCENPNAPNGPCIEVCAEIKCSCNPGYLLLNGKCVLPEECPGNCPIGCNGDPNASYDECPTSCPATCENPNAPNGPCIEVCAEIKCSCNPGYLLLNGKCVLPEECPGNKPCPPECKPTCAVPYPKNCKPNPNCYCGEGYVWNDKGDKCIKICDCPTNEPCPPECKPTCAVPYPKNCKPNPNCSCGEGYVWNDKRDKCIKICDCPTNEPCPPECKPTCAVPYPKNCKPNPNCSCGEGYVWNDKGDKCIKICDCPTNEPCPPECKPTCAVPYPKNCKPNPNCSCGDGYVWNDKGDKCIKICDCPTNEPCPPECKPTCAVPYPKNCKPNPNCSCGEGYVWNDKGDKCIKICDCPTNEPCPPECKPTCAVPKPKNCKPNPLCNCGDGYVWNDNRDRCIKITDCPSDCGCNGDPNAVVVQYPPPCPSTCDNPEELPCLKAIEPVGCVCKPGYILEKEGGLCIKPDYCHCGNPCGPNATFVSCKVDCPTDYCQIEENPITIICDPVYPCPSGCICNYNYKRLSTNDPRCILETDCPLINPCTRPNEVYDRCPWPCIARNCEDIENQPTICETLIGVPCNPQCVCKPDYFRNKEGICIPKGECPYPPCPRECKPTCSVPEPMYCDPNPNCSCGEGAVWNDNGDKCIKISNCPSDCGCNGDPNAVIMQHPPPCPSTCDNPEEVPCYKAVKPVGCVCKPGYILEKEGGKCIKPDNCSCGNPCGPNGTFVSCKVDCPTDYCPCDDNPITIICDPVYPCPSGCICKHKYQKLSTYDPRCILAQECPPVECTRPNEVWDSCPSPCLAESCKDVDNQPTVCETLIEPECQPRCVCKRGYCRDETGICVPIPDCSCKPCPPKCKPTCAVPEPENCTPNPNCSCGDGYVWNEKGDDCIKISNCPSDCGCNGDPNAVIMQYPPPCPSTCDNPEEVPCYKAVKPVGCVCKPGYILEKEGGKCIKPDNCPCGNPCGPNGTFVSCKVDCPTDYCPCDDNPITVICDPVYPCPSGCICKHKYQKLSPSDPRCILAQECPPVNCTRPNEVWDSCPSPCLAENCEDVDNQPTVCQTLIEPECQPRCVCKRDYCRDETSICVPIKDCPIKPCPPECKPTCAVPEPKNCKPNPNCSCGDGYVWNDKGDTCIKISDCPCDCGCNGDPNAVVIQNPPPCPSTCDNPEEVPCYKAVKPVGCVCKQGYILEKEGGKCIKPDDCPCGNPCGPNGTFVSCKVDCPSDYCPDDDNPVTIICDPVYPCPSGCICKHKYQKLSTSDPRCILAQECPPVNCTRPNEVWDSCPSPCLAENCEDVDNQPTVCETLIEPECQPRCVCECGYCRDETGICIPIEDCPSKPCPPECKPTCAVPEPKNCKPNPNCSCGDGYVWNDKGDKCIKISDCPSDCGCNGDPNAVVIQNPPPCPSTCDNPEEVPCYKAVKPVGCVCKPGYILEKEGGKCIKPDDCPCGNPCGPNGTFVSCKVDCPTDYCPVDDNPVTIICDPVYPCPSGCICKHKYQKLSTSDPRCILAQECPPVNCTRPNEVWDSCPSPCLAENCEDVDNQPTVCETLIEPECQPRCVCKCDYWRDETGICIPIEDCPSKPCPPECKPTCAVPEPKNCKPNPNCSCGVGYVWNDKGDKCIKISDCPSDCGCNGDPNAVVIQNPPPCPSTCDNPEEVHCYKAVKPVGCVCKPGYILEKEGGKCIKPDDCPCGNPCGPNGTFVSCKVDCPTDYCPVDDNPVTIICDPVYPCPSGCICKHKYQKLSTSDPRCILAQECPPVNCTRPNEMWDSCPSPCLAENCEDVDNQPTVCQTLIEPECQPRCVCKRDYCRDENGNCVPIKDCPSKPCPPECKPTCAVPEPKNCKPNPNCSCGDGYVWNDKGDKCIKISDCPSDCGCNGDPNAVVIQNPPPCPSTCDNPEEVPCYKAVKPVGCVCKQGYILEKEGGKCIRPDDCPCGNPCGANATFVSCKVECPNEYCPINDNRAIIICFPPYPCPSGCICKHKYRLLSADDPRCILAQECPPVNCTRPNEVWDSCPSPCLAENCEDIDNQPTVCETLIEPECQPRCVCKRDYCRDENGNCVPIKDCPSKPCPPECKPTCAVPEPENCEPNPNCSCGDGYVWNDKRDKCIKISDCPSDCGCNGDPNAEIIQNPPPCPSTCDNPEEVPCYKAAKPVGCVCKSGYILEKEGGKCIKPEDCPCGYPCGANETFVSCKVDCPNDYCPINDYPIMVACDPAYPCPSGCVCKHRYQRLSRDDPRCILAEECPPVNCTRPNEVWDSCPSPCLAENCEDVDNQPTTCETLIIPECQPRCVCKRDYCRNETGICVPIKDCPSKPCPPECKPTCAVPEPENCEQNPNCSCGDGYVWNDKGDKCIKISDCPSDCGCNGDPNAEVIQNPPPCPSTCDNPEEVPCYKAVKPVGCVCKSGYILEKEGGKCIKPEDCPCGYPCGANETFVSCKVDCPIDYCPIDDDPIVVACDPAHPCPSGCVCKHRYQRLSRDDPRCILAEECPPVKCTRPNEVWDECPWACLAENCEDVDNQPTTCETLIIPECQPRCVCKDDYFRNENGTCVPKEKCPSKPCPPECKPTCAVPNPKNCKPNPNCSCGDGYVWNDQGDKCIKICDCPSDCGCNGDMNAVISQNPSTCPSTCDRPDESSCCYRIPVGCVCKPGYILEKKDGKCIKPDDCPYGNPCGVNGTFASCKVDCPSDYCPIDDSNAIAMCSAPDPCPSGCICNYGYRRLSTKDPKCILAEDCPPQECTRKHEVWDRCPSPCYTDSCRDVHNRHSVCNTLIAPACNPRCVCKKNFARNDNNVCIPKRKCPNW